jgi:hypothetical protein
VNVFGVMLHGIFQVQVADILLTSSDGRETITFASTRIGSIDYVIPNIVSYFEE